MHAKNEVSISFCSKVMAKVKVFVPQTETCTDRKEKKTSKFEELWSPARQQFVLEVGQGSRPRSLHGTSACHKDDACQISMLYH